MLHFLSRLLLSITLLLVTPLLPAADPTDQADDLVFNEEPLSHEVALPNWFKPSFLNLKEDLTEAAKAGKKGIILYFGQKYCVYCQALMEVNFRKPDLVAYTRQHFEVIAIDIWGDREVTDLQGKTLSEKEFALREQTNFTPSLLFYDLQGREALYLPGYYPPYKFQAALEYVAGEHYSTQSFRQYLVKGEAGFVDDSGLNQNNEFEAPPYLLNRSQWSASRPLVVFFEQGNCHACNVLHTDILQQEEISKLLQAFERVQLNMWADTPVITPDGKKLTARQWADSLNLFYAPTLVFFDETGKEILRLDSTTYSQRLGLVLQYIVTKGYQQQRYFHRWRERYLSDQAESSERISY